MLHILLAAPITLTRRTDRAGDPHRLDRKVELASPPKPPPLAVV